jgi:hypothetical protein
MAAEGEIEELTQLFMVHYHDKVPPPHVIERLYRHLVDQALLMPELFIMRTVSWFRPTEVPDENRKRKLLAVCYGEPTPDAVYKWFSRYLYKIEQPMVKWDVLPHSIQMYILGMVVTQDDMLWDATLTVVNKQWNGNLKTLVNGYIMRYSRGESDIMKRCALILHHLMKKRIVVSLQVRGIRPHNTNFMVMWDRSYMGQITKFMNINSLPEWARGDVLHWTPSYTELYAIHSTKRIRLMTLQVLLDRAGDNDVRITFDDRQAAPFVLDFFKEGERVQGPDKDHKKVKISREKLFEDVVKTSVLSKLRFVDNGEE